MSAEGRRIVLMCLASEIDAFERDLARTGPKRDHLHDRTFDIREDHLAKLRSARREVEVLR